MVYDHGAQDMGIFDRRCFASWCGCICISSCLQEPKHEKQGHPSDSWLVFQIRNWAAVSVLHWSAGWISQSLWFVPWKLPLGNPDVANTSFLPRLWWMVDFGCIWWGGVGSHCGALSLESLVFQEWKPWQRHDSDAVWEVSDFAAAFLWKRAKPQPGVQTRSLHFGGTSWRSWPEPSSAFKNATTGSHWPNLGRHMWWWHRMDRAHQEGHACSQTSCRLRG